MCLISGKELLMTKVVLLRLKKHQEKKSLDIDNGKDVAKEQEEFTVNEHETNNDADDNTTLYNDDGNDSDRCIGRCRLSALTHRK